VDQNHQPIPGRLAANEGREAWSFAKKLANHIGAMKLFLCHYNLTNARVATLRYMRTCLMSVAPPQCPETKVDHLENLWMYKKLLAA
jgi:hypothetical protein